MLEQEKGSFLTYHLIIKSSLSSHLPPHPDLEGDSSIVEETDMQNCGVPAPTDTGARALEAL